MSHASDVALQRRNHLINLLAINIVGILRCLLILFSYFKLTGFLQRFGLALQGHHLLLLWSIVEDIIRHGLREIANGIGSSDSLHFLNHLILRLWVILHREKLEHLIKVGCSSVRSECNWKLGGSLWFQSLRLRVNIKHRLFIHFLWLLHRPHHSHFAW